MVIRAFVLKDLLKPKSNMCPHRRHEHLQVGDGVPLLCTVIPEARVQLKRDGFKFDMGHGCQCATLSPALHITNIVLFAFMLHRQTDQSLLLYAMPPHQHLHKDTYQSADAPHTRSHDDTYQSAATPHTRSHDTYQSAAAPHTRSHDDTSQAASCASRKKSIGCEAFSW